jgi:hypothetical protein
MTKLTRVERKTLANQFTIFEKLDPGSAAEIRGSVGEVFHGLFNTDACSRRYRSRST